MRRSTRTSVAQACVNCQKRKSRCSGSNSPGEPCLYCRRTNKTCSFREPPVRTSLTRENLDASEKQCRMLAQRCEQLERLLRAISPGINIAKELQQLSSDGPMDPASRQGSLGSHSGTDESPQKQPAIRGSSGNEVLVSSPHLPGFQWRARNGRSHTIESESETEDNPDGDGMANLHSVDSGYLGGSSGSDLLLEIAKLLPDTSTLLATTSGNGTPTPPQHIDPPQLSSTVVASRLIDAYFLFFNSSYPIFHEKTFRHQVSEYWSGQRPASSRDAWPVAYYMALAIGHWASTPYNPRFLSPYYFEARSRLSISMLETGNVEALQASLLLANYLQKNDRLNAGYVFLGIAIHITLSMGLHREDSYTPNDILSERRRRLFWVVFLFDSGFSITTGRPLGMSLEGVVDCKMPVNFDDRESETTFDPTHASEDSPTAISALVAHSRLASIANGLYAQFLLARTQKKKINYQVAEYLDRDLQTWLKELPAYFFSASVPVWFIHARSVIMWKYQNMRILLWRGTTPRHPYLVDHHPPASFHCIDTALDAITDISAFCQRYHDLLNMSINWYATYHLFQATLVVEAAYIAARLGRDKDRQAINATDHPRHDDTLVWRRAVDRAKESMQLLARNNNSAQRCLEIIEKIHRHFEAREAAWPRPTAGEFDSPPEPMPSSFAGENPNANFTTEFSSIGNFGMSLDNFQSDQTLRLLVDQMPLGLGNMEMSWDSVFAPEMGISNLTME